MWRPLTMISIAIPLSVWALSEWAGRHSPGRPGLRPHIRLLRGSRPLYGHYYPSPGPGDSVSPGEAGLTPKPHRDQSTRSRLTWAVSPAAGIGLPDVTPRRGATPGATTDPGECHE